MITGMPRIAVAVHDFPTTVATFREKLGMPVVDLSDTSVSQLGAKLAMCVPQAGSNIEIMSPADPDAPLSQSLKRFLDRRGQGLFALMLEAPDPESEAEDLSHRGLNVIPLMPGAGGRDIHPNSTHGVLIRVYPVNSFQQQDDDRGSDTCNLSGVTRVIIAVQDLNHAMDVYGRKLAMDIAHPTIVEQWGVRSAICRPPSGGVIELVSVEDPLRPFAQSLSLFLQDNREGMYCLVLESGDLVSVENSLRQSGFEITRNADSSDLQIDLPFGVHLLIQAA